MNIEAQSLVLFLRNVTMKTFRIILTIILMILGMTNTYARKVSDSYINKVERISKTITEEKEKYIGKPLNLVYITLKKQGFKIKDLSSMASSPYIDPQGNSYVNGVIIFSHNDEERVMLEKEYIVIFIKIEDTGILQEDFDYNLPDDYDDNDNVGKKYLKDFINKTKSYKIKDIKYKKTRND